jgi:hypothetical protein
VGRALRKQPRPRPNLIERFDMTEANPTHDPSACPVCPERTGEGWQIQNVTHCPECGATWRMATNANHCKQCHLTFATLDAGYRLHTDRGHPDPATVGLVAQANRWGTIEWGTVEGFEARAARAARLTGSTKEDASDEGDE